MKKETIAFEGYLFDSATMRQNGYKELLGFDNNIVTYLNNDNSKTVYVSSVPIEKNKLRLQQEGKVYRSTSDHATVEFPIILNQRTGIRIEDFMEVYPATMDTSIASYMNRVNAFGQAQPCIAYKNVFGNLPLYCYATSFGLNMEIVIPKRMDNNVFTLKMKQPSYFYTEVEPDYIDFRDEVDLQSLIYTSIAIDANNAWNYRNRVELVEGKDGAFMINFIIDKDFLNNPETQYPVTLNQSIYAYRHKQPDTSVYSQTDMLARHYLSPYLLLGDNTERGEGMALLRFEVLDNLNICPEDILKAEYCFTNLVGQKQNAIVGVYAVTSDWCSVNTRWDSRPKYDQLPVRTTKVQEQGTYGIEITRLLREMMRNKGKYVPLYSVRNSFLLKSNCKGTNLLLAAGDAGFFPPYLKIILKE